MTTTTTSPEETKPLGSLGGTTAATTKAAEKVVTPTDIRVLDSADIRARRRPRAIFLMWSFELFCSFLIASPLQAWTASVWGAHPDGDAVLFRPGGHALITWLGEESPVLPVITRTTFLSLIVFAIVGQIISAAVIASLTTKSGESRPAPISKSLRAGASAFWAFIVIGILTNALQGFLLGIGLFVSSGLDHSFAERMGDARSFTLRLVVLAFFVILTLGAGVIADLTRVALVRAGLKDETLGTGQRLRDAITLAARTARGAIGRAMLAWAWRAAIAFALIYVGSIAGDLVGERGGGALWLLFFFHQAILFGRAALRTSWLANALRLVKA